MNTITHYEPYSLMFCRNGKIKFVVDKIFIIVVLLEVVTIFFLLFKILNVHYQRDVIGWIIYQTKYKRVVPSGDAFPETTIFWRESDDPIFHGELIPNHYQIFEGFGVKLNSTIIKINSDGFRDREYTIEKPNNTIRIIVLGDSVTFGWGVNITDTYSKLLEKMLNSDFNTTINFEVLNMGVPGFNTLEEVHFLEKKGLKYKPDIVIIGYVAGDAENNTKLKTREIHNEVEKIMSKFRDLPEIEKTFYRNSLASQLLRNDLNKNLKINLEYYVLNSLKKVKDLTQEEKIKVIIVYLTDISPIEKEKITEFAKNADFCIIDVYNYLKKYPLESIILNEKDSHYNSFAHKLIAEAIFSQITKKNSICTYLTE